MLQLEVFISQYVDCQWGKYKRWAARLHVGSMLAVVLLSRAFYCNILVVFLDGLSWRSSVHPHCLFHSLFCEAIWLTVLLIFTLWRRIQNGILSQTPAPGFSTCSSRRTCCVKCFWCLRFAPESRRENVPETFLISISWWWLWRWTLCHNTLNYHTSSFSVTDLILFGADR